MNQHGEIILYQTEDGMTKIGVRFEDETVWLTQQQKADLFQPNRSNIAKHIQHIYAEGELDEDSACRIFRQVRTEGNRQVTRESISAPYMKVWWPRNWPPTAVSCFITITATKARSII